MDIIGAMVERGSEPQNAHKMRGRKQNEAQANGAPDGAAGFDALLAQQTSVQVVPQASSSTNTRVASPVFTSMTADSAMPNSSTNGPDMPSADQTGLLLSGAVVAPTQGTSEQVLPDALLSAGLVSSSQGVALNLSTPAIAGGETPTPTEGQPHPTQAQSLLGDAKASITVPASPLILQDSQPNQAQPSLELTNLKVPGTAVPAIAAGTLPVIGATSIDPNANSSSGKAPSVVQLETVLPLVAQSAPNLPTPELAITAEPVLLSPVSTAFTSNAPASARSSNATPTTTAPDVAGAVSPSATVQKGFVSDQLFQSLTTAQTAAPQTAETVQSDQSLSSAITPLGQLEPIALDPVIQSAPLRPEKHVGQSSSAANAQNAPIMPSNRSDQVTMVQPAPASPISGTSAPDAAVIGLEVSEFTVPGAVPQTLENGLKPSAFIGLIPATPQSVAQAQASLATAFAAAQLGETHVHSAPGAQRFSASRGDQQTAGKPANAVSAWSNSGATASSSQSGTSIVQVTNGITDAGSSGSANVFDIAAQTQGTGAQLTAPDQGMAKADQASTFSPALLSNTASAAASDGSGLLGLNEVAGSTGTSGTSGTSEAAPRTTPALLPQSLQHLAATMVRRLDNGLKEFSLRLDPVELGKIDVKLTMGSDNKVRAVIAADKPEALGDLINAAKELARALTDAGLDLEENGLSFDLNDQGQGQQAGQDHNEKRHTKLANGLNGRSLFDTPNVNEPIASTNHVERWSKTRFGLVA